MAHDILSDVLVDGILTANNVSGTNTGDQTITLTGDITGSGTGSFATAIAAGAIVNADINAAAAIALSKLAEAVIQADGGQAFTAAQSMGSFNLTNVADPASAQDAATKAYVDSLLDGRSWKSSATAATTAALPSVTYNNGAGTLTATANGALAAQDGVTLTINQRLVVKDQASAFQNGLYAVTDVGSAGTPFILTRTTDTNTAIELTGAAVFVEQGTVNADMQFAQTADSITLGTTGITWVITSANSFSGHDMISLSGGQISVDVSSTGGLESSNAGNAAGQIRIKLDGATLVTGASGLRLDTLGTPASGTLTNCTGLPVSTGISGLAAGIATFLATPSSANLASAVTDETGTGALVFANTPTLVAPVLGTPTSGTLTNCTNLPVSTGISGLAAGIATFLATATSANLAAAVTDETGSGALVFANSPTLVTPALGTPSALVGTNITGTASGLEAGTVTSIGNLTGDVTSTNRATSIAATVVTGKVLTGYSSGAGTVAATDTILQAINKLNGNQVAGAVQRFSATFGDGAASSFTIAHGLTGSDLTAVVRRVSDGEVVGVETKINSTNVILGVFNTIPTAGQFRVTVVG